MLKQRRTPRQEFNAGRSDALNGRKMVPTSLDYAKGYARGMELAEQRDRKDFSAGYLDGILGKTSRRSMGKAYYDGHAHGRSESKD